MAHAAVSYRSEPMQMSAPKGGLALSLQEAFTAAVRIRTNRMDTDRPDTFRNRIRQILQHADDQAVQYGYPEEDITLAVYAFTVFLDETIMQTPGGTFTDWARQPLQEELFEGFRGGELFFEYLSSVLNRSDNHQTADLLEVYQLCLHLGYRGKYRNTDEGSARALIQTVAEKIGRIRGTTPELSPSWRLPRDENLPTGLTTDPWLPRLVLGFVGLFILMMFLLMIFKIIGNSGVSDVRTEASQLEYVQP